MRTFLSYNPERHFFDPDVVSAHGTFQLTESAEFCIAELCIAELCIAELCIAEFDDDIYKTLSLPNPTQHLSFWLCRTTPRQRYPLDRSTLCYHSFRATLLRPM